MGKEEKVDLDFEISFYEGVLDKNPGFIQAMVMLGESYTKKGLHDKALENDKRLVQLRPDDPIARYNLACDYSLLKDADSSLDCLEKALFLGYDDFKFMQKDKDLDYIRKDKRYRLLISKYAPKKRKIVRDSCPDLNI